MGFEKIFEKFHKAAEGFLRFIELDAIKLTNITDGVNVDKRILEKMREKGWKIEESETKLVTQRTVPVLTPPGSTALTYTLTFFTAAKDGHEKGGKLWFEDLCAVTGIPCDKAPKAYYNDPQP